MKQLISTLLCSLVLCFGFSQDPIEIIEERLGDKQIKLFAISTLEEVVEITFNAELSGFTTSTPLPVIKSLSKDNKIELITLDLTPNVECSYTTSLSYKKVQKANLLPSKTVLTTSPTLLDNQRLTSIEINPEKINIFTKNGCGRCTFVKEYFDKNKIPYTELNTSIHQPNSTLMFDELQKSGFASGSVTMPVVIFKGQVTHSIKDLQKFVDGFKK